MSVQQQERKVRLFILTLAAFVLIYGILDPPGDGGAAALGRAFAVFGLLALIDRLDPDRANRRVAMRRSWDALVRVAEAAFGRSKGH